MSDIFKLKVCIGNANIELEGEGNLVHTIFSELREDGLGKLSDSVPVEIKNDVSDREIGNNIPCEEKNNIEIKEPQIKETSKLPQINTIVIKNLPKTETEWIVVYALYVSEQGTKIFNKEDLRQLYQDSGRLDENRNKNFSTNINPREARSCIFAYRPRFRRLTRMRAWRRKKSETYTSWTPALFPRERDSTCFMPATLPKKAF